MTDYAFDNILAVDSSGPELLGGLPVIRVASNALVSVFDVNDPTKTPVALKTVDGLPIPNPVQVNALGMGPAPVAQVWQLGWEGGGLSGVWTSNRGLRDETVAALEAAQGAQLAAENAAATAGTEAAAAASSALAGAVADAASAKASAEAAAALVEAPADSAIAAAITGTGTETKAALSATFVPKWKAATAYAAGDKVISPDGDVVTAKASFTSGASFNAVNWNLGSAFMRNVNAFELVPHWVYGHSYTQGGFVPDDAKWAARVARRLGTKPITVNGISGYKMQQAAAKAIATWAPGSRGLVEVVCLVNDVSQYGTDVKGPPTTAAAFRAFLAMVSAGQVLLATTSPFAYSAGWSNGAVGGTGRSPVAVTSTVGSYVDVTFTGDTADLSVNLVATGGGTITATMGGNTLGTINTSGYFENAPGVLTVSGLGAGSHTVRFTMTAGTSVGIDALYVRNPNPPTVILYKEGWILNFGAQNSALNVALTSTYPAALDPVLAAFPNALSASADNGWDPTTMLIADNIHPNDAGYSYIASRMVAALLGQPFREGQNVMVGAGFAYTGTTGGSATGLPWMGIFDNFNRANVGSLGTTSDGMASWTSVNMYISSNQARGSNGGGDSLNWIDAGGGKSDVTVKATVAVLPSSSTQVGVGGRFTDQSNFWRVNQVGGVWVIQKKVAGVVSTPTGGTSTVTAAAGQILELTMVGTTITLKVNGTQAAQVTGDSFNQTATKHGLFAGNNGVDPYMDDFSITTAP